MWADGLIIEKGVYIISGKDKTGGKADRADVAAHPGKILDNGIRHNN
jgi:antitoxin MazE